jgi:aspartyl-tRNA(Asn)/glutamyl-tRNA(Gln) amidotransferase subunit B
MPMLPSMQENLLVEKYKLSAYDANAICTDKEDVIYFETIVANTNNAKATVNWITGPIRNYCNENNSTLSTFPLSTNTVTNLINFTNTGKVHFNIASTKLMQTMIAENKTNAEELAATLNLLQEDNEDAINDWVQKTILAMPDKVKEYKAGKKGLIGLFAGQVKKLSGGKADMGKVNALLEKRLME